MKIVLALALALASAEEVKFREIEQWRKSLEIARRVSRTSYCEARHNDPDIAFDHEPFAGAPTQVKALCPVTVEKWCDVSADACSRKYGLSNCGSPLEKMGKRAANLELRKDITSHVSKLFYQTVKDPAIQAKCCGSDRACKAKLAASELRIVQGPMSLTDEHGHPRLNAVAYAERGHAYFSEAILLQYKSAEALSHGVLHEIGHLCQFSRHANDSYEENYRNGRKFDELSAANRADYDAVWGPALRTCVEQALATPFADATTAAVASRQSDPKTNLPSKPSWEAESFAEVFAASIYPDLNANPDFWYSVCGGGSDWAHGPTRPIMNCVIQHNAEVRGICR